MGTLKKIFILHGWTYSTEKWTNFINLLKNEGFEVFLLKIPGLTAESYEIWNLDKYTEWLNELLEKYKGKIILLGHSNGGRIAINYAFQHPNKLNKLILIDSAAVFHNEFPIKLKRIVFKYISLIGKKLTKSNILRKALYKLAREGDYEKANENMKITITNLINTDLTPVFNKIKTPTLIIWGENDQITPIKDAYLINKLVDGSKLHVIKGAKHAPFFTNSDEVVKIIKNDI